MAPRVILRIERHGYGPFTHPSVTCAVGSLVQMKDPFDDFGSPGIFSGGMRCGFSNLEQMRHIVYWRDMVRLLRAGWSLVRVAAPSPCMFDGKEQAVYYPEEVISKERISWRYAIGDRPLPNMLRQGRLYTTRCVRVNS